MDELQTDYLSNQDAIYFCKSTADFTLAETGFDAAGDGEAYPYVLVTRGGTELEDGETYRVAFIAANYTEEVGEKPR